MIVKIKTFSGETLYLPEEDYLNEIVYSENLEEREFTKEDYRGLTRKGREDLQKRRSTYAEQLGNTYRKTQQDISGIRPGEYTGLTTRWSVAGGGAGSRGVTETTNWLGLYQDGLKQHMNEVNGSMQKETKNAAKIMKDKVLKRDNTYKQKLGKVLNTPNVKAKPKKLIKKLAKVRY